MDLGFDVLRVPKAAVKLVAKVDLGAGLSAPQAPEEQQQIGTELKDQSIRDWGATRRGGCAGTDTNWYWFHFCGP